MIYKSVERNYDNTQHGLIRKNVEKPYTDFHDALSAHYYENRDKAEKDKQAFVYKNRDYGVLTKEIFDKLHGSNEDKRHKAVMTDIIAVYDYKQSKGNKPSYLSENECTTIVNRLREGEIDEIKAKIAKINNKQYDHEAVV